MTDAESLPPAVLAAIQEAARRDVANAPPLKQWQLDILRPLCVTRRKTARRRAA